MPGFDLPWRANHPAGYKKQAELVETTATGKPATATDANSNTTSFSYDLLDRLLSVTDAMGRTTSYGYDALSRQTSISNLAIQPRRRAR